MTKKLAAVALLAVLVAGCSRQPEPAPYVPPADVPMPGKGAHMG